MMKPWFALAKKLPAAVKLQLRGTGTDRAKEHRIVSDAQGRQWIEVGQMHPAVVADPAVAGSCAVVIKPVFAEDASFGVLIRALPALNSSGFIDLLQLQNATAVTRTETCTGPRAPSFLGGSMSATITSSPPTGGPPTALKLAYKASACPKCGTGDIGCVDNTFVKPLNLSTHRVLEVQLWSGCDGSYALLPTNASSKHNIHLSLFFYLWILDSSLDSCWTACRYGCAWGYIGLQLGDGGVNGDFRDFIIQTNWTGWRTVRLAIPATRGMYTTDFPKPGNENMVNLYRNDDFR